MRHIVMFSGGKDSLATLVWAKATLFEFEICFCDTGWENIKTYQHIAEIERWVGRPIRTLSSSTYSGFEDLTRKKKRVASPKARFCTEKLKVEPSIDYILSIHDDVKIYQGVRAEESRARATLAHSDDYFKFYFEPYGYSKKGRAKYHSYRKNEVIARSNAYSTDVIRPVLKKTAQEVFDMIFSSGLKVNPLYYEGFGRVGCFPCVMCSHAEIALIATNYPEVINRIRQLEVDINGRSFFPPGYIPDRFCNKHVISKDGKHRIYYPTIDDVVRYVLGDGNQSKMFHQPHGEGCVSVYSICERNA